MNWTLHVEGFGKIDKTDIKVAPFTMFVGDNNSGKSYLMTLIYGLLNMSDLQLHRFPTNDEESGDAALCRDVLNGILNCELTTENGSYVLQPEEFKAMERCFNRILDYNKEILVETFFNRKVDIAKLQISFEYNGKAAVAYKRHSGRWQGNQQSTQIELTVDTGKKKSRMFQIQADNTAELRVDNVFFVVWTIFNSLLKEDFGGNFNEVAYLPAVRTGFLLTYKTLTGQAIDRLFNNSFIQEENGGDYDGYSTGWKTPVKNPLTKPAADFLRKLANMDTDNATGEFAEITDFIEKEILTGTVAVKNAPSPDFRYIPKESSGGQELPMFLSSGVVTELTPLLLFLRYRSVGTLILEEPEMCLHPKLQWLLTKALIRISNKGVPVLMATHSDTILQHVNNMIKLQGQEEAKRAELMQSSGYGQEDLLGSGQARVYQFTVNESIHRTEISELKGTKQGFAAPTFLNTLRELLQETRALEDGER